MAPIPNNDTPTTTRKRLNAKSTASTEAAESTTSVLSEKVFTWEEVAKHNSEVCV